MALKFYTSPFHAIEAPELASKSVLKAQLMIMIRDLIKERGWTQKEAANQLNTTQPRISDIVNGKIDNFTLDALVSILEKLNVKLEFSLASSENYQDNSCRKTISIFTGASQGSTLGTLGLC